MKIITFSEARNKFKAVLDRVVNDADYTVIILNPVSIEYLKLV